MANLNCVLKSRDITLPTKVHTVKAMVFPVVMYGCEGWVIKKAEYQTVDAFKLPCWRRLLRVPGTARSNQSIQKEINPEYSLEGLMLKLKFQYFDHLVQRANSLEKTLMLVKIEGKSEVEITKQSSLRSETSVLFSINFTVHCPEFLEYVFSLINYQHSDPGKGSN